MNIKPFVKSEYAEGLRAYAVGLFDAWQHLGADDCLDQILSHIESQYPEATVGDVCYAMEAVDPLIDELLSSSGERDQQCECGKPCKPGSDWCGTCRG